MRLLTIGVYGFKEDSFFQALQDAGVDTFCDLRARRGLRGHEYAFANSAHLQQRLAAMSIRYIHVKELATPEAIRARQLEEDHQAHLGQRSRQRLGEQFIQAYTASCLASFDAGAFVRELGGAQVIALFCVEREPEACHRSLVANHLSEALGLPVTHLLPTP